MPRNHLPAEEYVYDRASLLAYFAASSDSSRNKPKMMKILMSAVHNELTEPQRFCLIEHYLHGRKMKDIAFTLSVNPSTVTRHIQRAIKRLRRITDYY